VITALLFTNFKDKGSSMKIIGTWCLLALLAVGSTAWAQAKPASDSTEKAIAALENQWLQSQKTNNPDLVCEYRTRWQGEKQGPDGRV
jgi:hypothetical protein